MDYRNHRQKRANLAQVAVSRREAGAAREPSRPRTALKTKAIRAKSLRAAETTAFGRLSPLGAGAGDPVPPSNFKNEERT